MDGLAVHGLTAFVKAGVVFAVDLACHVEAHAEIGCNIAIFDAEADAVGSGKGTVVEFVAVLVGVAGLWAAHFDWLSISIVFHFQRQVLHWRVRWMVKSRP